MTDAMHNETEIADFVYADDIEAVKRIWREIGWTDDENGDAQVERFYAIGRVLVAKIFCSSPAIASCFSIGAASSPIEALRPSA